MLLPLVPAPFACGVAVGEGEASIVGDADACAVGEAAGLVAGVGEAFAVADAIMVSTSMGLVRGGRH